MLSQIKEKLKLVWRKICDLGIWLKKQFKKLLVILGIGVVLATGDLVLQPDKIPFVEVNGQKIEFPYTDNNSGEDLIIRTNSSTTNGIMYVMIENKSGKLQNVSLSAFFGKEEQKIKEIYELNNNGWQLQTLKEFKKSDYVGIIKDEKIAIKDKRNFEAKKKVEKILNNKQISYYKIVFQYPLLMAKPEQFFLEIIGDKGGYGHLDPWLTGWTYRKQVTVTNASTSYQTKILVGESAGATGEEVDCNSHVQTDFDDLRFTGSNGQTLLDYWIESITGTTPNQLATVWVENDTTPSATCYMYYGKADATAVSDGTNTFILFDHFDDGIITGWTQIAGTWTESGTVITCDPGIGYQGILLRTSSPNMGSGALRNRSQMDNWYDVNVGSTLIARYANANNFYQESFGQNYHGLNKFISPNWITIDFNVVSHSINTYYIMDFMLNGNNLIGFDGTDTASGTATNVASGNIGIKTWQDKITVDWFLQRAYTTPEPTWGSWGSEETEAVVAPTSQIIIIE